MAIESLNKHTTDVPQAPSKSTCGYRMQPDFAKWLQSPQAIHSGDAFYWQHQEELQPSMLQFTPSPSYQDTLPNNEHHFKQSTASNSAAILEKNIKNKRFEFKVGFDFTPDLYSKNCNNERGIQEEILSTPLKPRQASLFTQNTDSLKENSVHNATPKKNDVFSSTIAKPAALKNNHLFVQEGEAELCVNLREFNHYERSQIVLLLKKQLRGAGLLLKTLIINGDKNA